MRDMSDSSREAFESAVENDFEKPTFTSLERDGEGYMDGYVDNAWWGWQAAKQSMQGEAVWEIKRDSPHILTGIATSFDVSNLPDGTPLYTHAPDSATLIAEQSAEITRLRKELEEARKDAEVVAWYRETAGGIEICYVQNEPPKDADGPWHPLCTSARKKWIPMNERRPIEEHGNKVLGFGDGYIFECEYECIDGEGHWCNITGETMTHWMPLPPRPDASLNIKGGAECANTSM